MKLKSLLLVWPLPVSPFAAVATAWLAGPVYTTAPNQDSMLIRFLGSAAWVLVALTSAGVMPVVLKMKTAGAWVISSSASLGSVALFNSILNRMD